MANHSYEESDRPFDVLFVRRNSWDSKPHHVRLPDNSTFIFPALRNDQPGRHRLEGKEHSPTAVYMVDTFRKFECPRGFDDGIAVEFEYL